MNELEALFKAYKNREYKKQTYNTTSYINYSNAVKNQINKLDITQFKTGNTIHYMTNTFLGSYMYNAKIIDISNNSITIKPCGSAWKNRTLIFNNGESVYMAKGWL